MPLYNLRSDFGLHTVYAESVYAAKRILKRRGYEGPFVIESVSDANVISGNKANTDDVSNATS